MIFVYLVYKPIEHLRVTRKTWKEMLLDGVQCEILRQFKTIQDARNWIHTQSKKVEDEIEETYTGITPEGRERMREKKRGANNPNAGGLSPEHKAKISQNKRIAYRGEFNPMYNRRHKPSSRLKIGIANMRRGKRRWAVDEYGKEHFISIAKGLPPGWTWGRARNVNRRF